MHRRRPPLLALAALLVALVAPASSPAVAASAGVPTHRSVSAPSTFMSAASVTSGPNRARVPRPRPRMTAPRPPARPARGPVAPAATVKNGPNIAAGAPAVGSARYPVPVGALVLSPTGNDSAAGTVSAPRRSVAAAVLSAPPGTTLVLRGGVYRESVIVPDTADSLTIQPYPGEAVWFDGSRIVTGFTKAGATWSTRWGQAFDASPTFTRGARDNTAPGWRFLDPAYPMAAHPEQVWIDGVAQRQVPGPAQVVTGTFAIDPVSARLVLGTDPRGRTVAASALGRAFLVTGRSTTLRGLGIRRFSSSVPDFGVVSGYAPRLTLESMTIRDSATIGVGVAARGCVLRTTTITGSGMIGVTGYQADGLALDRVVLSGNNTQRFNAAPIAGGLKTSASRGLSVRNSLIENNAGPGLWFDESSYDLRVTGNTVRANAGVGVFVELSAKAVISGNDVRANARQGIAIRNSSDITIRANTVVQNARAIDVTQDERLAADATIPGHDKRTPNDPHITWLIGRMTIQGNIVGSRKGTDAVVAVEDWTMRRHASSMAIALDGNSYLRPRGTTRWAVVWSRRGTDPYVYDSVADFRSAQRQERSGVEITS